MDNVFDDATDVTVAFRVVESTEFGGTFAGPCVGFEDGGFTFALGLNIFTHAEELE